MVFGLNRLFKNDGREPCVPVGRRIYAIGDIHGRVDLLDALHEVIRDDAKAYKDMQRVIIYLGDYIDRGLNSKDVIDRLVGPRMEGFERVCLKGNHEAVMLQFLSDPRVGADWINFGGRSTLLSYGVGLQGASLRAYQKAQEDLRDALPPAHDAFLRGLALTHIEGDYLFVHAGLRPGVPINGQTEKDLIWIREPFLSSREWHGKVVVHGHTISGKPELSNRRIGIDTAAYATGVLTCLVLSGSERTFIAAE